MEVKRFIDMLNEPLGGVSVTWSTDYEVDHSLRQGIETLNKGHLDL